MVTYILISFINVILHIFRSILVIKSSKLSASFWNCICYTFSAIVVKYIAEVNLITAIMVQAFTNFFGCYIGMLLAEWYTTKHKQL